MPTRLKEGQDSGALLGKGHLAMTIDQGADMSRYQGLVALEGGNLEDAAHEYFLRSEQIPTRVRLAVGEEWRGGGDGPKHRWRAGGMLLQFLPKAPERARQADLHPGDAPEGVETHEVAEDDAWVEGQSLIATVEDIELLDPDCPASGCCIACSTNAACACSRHCRCARNAPARAKRCRQCSTILSQKTAPKWSRTARWW